MAAPHDDYKVLDHIICAIDNYAIIVHETLQLDPEWSDSTTQALLRTVFEIYVPLFEADFFCLRAYDLENDPDVERCRKSLYDFLEHGKKFKPLNHELAKLDSIDAHESPLVLLLTLALKKKRILLERGQDPDVNWGRLHTFPQYLKGLKFLAKKNDQGEDFWPGLPHVIMFSLPIWTSNDEYRASVSSSYEKFGVLASPKIESRRRRSQRLKELQALCGPESQRRIESVRDFSVAMERQFGPEGSRSRSVYQTWEEFFRLGVAETKKPYSLKSHHFQCNSYLPCYLPAVVSTWMPNGVYKRSCLLDSLRFGVLRPPEAEKVESTPREKKGAKERKVRVPASTACAEWDGFINIISQLERQHGRARSSGKVISGHVAQSKITLSGRKNVSAQEGKHGSLLLY
ncbi:hypothetical protein F5X97DRAFT_289398 [Nemania serpens]|nr:hypothetical protein F5X97DRAFT_289398 [Nemania serpens]